MAVRQDGLSYHYGADHTLAVDCLFRYFCRFPCVKVCSAPSFPTDPWFEHGTVEDLYVPVCARQYAGSAKRYERPFVEQQIRSVCGTKHARCVGYGDCSNEYSLVLDVEIVGETGQIKLKVFPEYEEQVRQTIQSSLADLGGNRIEVTTSAPLQTAQPKA
eukprot:m.311164 g.311164  ORF g.311164 m.311164 type:complete len:160 (+) comp15952_c0_seq27:310-789(+)